MLFQQQNKSSLQIAADKKLAKRMIKGEQKAVSEFCDVYLPKLYRYARLRLPTEDDLNEVVQIVLTKAARGINTYRGEASLLTWVIQICRHEISRYLERSQRKDIAKPYLNDELLLAVVEALEAPINDEPEYTYKRAELINTIHFVLDHIPERYAQALELKYIEGLSSQEIAQKTGISDTAVQSLLARARKAFKDVCIEVLPIEFEWGEI